MKKKISLALLLFITGAITVQAQNLSIHAGINSSNMHFKFVPDANNPLDTSFSLDPKTNLRLGAEYHFHFKNSISMETGLYYSTRSRVQSNKSEMSEFEDVIAISYIEMPLNIRYAFPVGDISIHLRGGAMLGYAVSGSRSGYSQTTIPGFPVVRNEYDEKLEIGGENEFKSFDAGYNLGFGIVYNKIALNLNYNRTIGSIFNNSNYPDSKSTTKWGVTNLTLGFTLF